MSRLHISATIEAAPAAAQPLLRAVERQFGVVPNLFRLVAASPAALDGYVGMSAALAKGRLPAAPRERIALAVAAVNGCSYCLSAHTYLGKHVTPLDDAELAANRSGTSNDPTAAAAVSFAAQVATQRGHVSETELAAVRAAGFDDTQIGGIVRHVALNSWINDVNEVTKTDIDFPVVRPSEAA